MSVGIGLEYNACCRQSSNCRDDYSYNSYLAMAVVVTAVATTVVAVKLKVMLMTKEGAGYEQGNNIATTTTRRISLQVTPFRIKWGLLSSGLREIIQWTATNYPPRIYSSPLSGLSLQ